MKHAIIAAILLATPAAAQDCERIREEAPQVAEAMNSNIALLTDAATVAATGRLLGTDETADSFAAISQAIRTALNFQEDAAGHIKAIIDASGC